LVVKPGPALDALVAEHVMGWDEDDTRFPFDGRGRHFSTNIVDAWEVMERLREGSMVSIHWAMDIHQHWRWVAILGDGQATSDESASHAICLAAIAAL
jgi:hypothetical protein